MQKAFTLIELLVVVLIIGILSAVALPQYNKAVRKAQFTQLITAANSLAQAQRRFFLANGTYAYDLNNLDIQVGTISSSNNGVTYLPKAGYCIIGENPETVNCHFGLVSAIYEVAYTNQRQICCSYPSDNYAADGLCKNLWGGEWTNGCSAESACHCWKN